MLGKYDIRQNPANNKWVAQIVENNGKHIQIGHYDTEQDAHDALDKIIMLLYKKEIEL